MRNYCTSLDMTQTFVKRWIKWSLNRKIWITKCDPRRELEGHSCPKLNWSKNELMAMAARGESAEMGTDWEHLQSQVRELWFDFELQDLKLCDVELSHFPRREVRGSDSALLKDHFQKKHTKSQKMKKTQKSKWNSYSGKQTQLINSPCPSQQRPR